jgi:hypothetical protein
VEAVSIAIQQCDTYRDVDDDQLVVGHDQNAMHELDDVAMRELQLHATLIAEGRFDYTESEADLAKNLRERSAVLAGVVAGFVAP